MYNVLSKCNNIGCFAWNHICILVQKSRMLHSELSSSRAIRKLPILLTSSAEPPESQLPSRYKTTRARPDIIRILEETVAN